MHLPINVKSPNNINKWQMRFSSAFKGLMRRFIVHCKLKIWARKSIIAWLGLV
jgi:hypothetical protein